MTKRVIVIHTAECGETTGADQGIKHTLEKRKIPVHYICDSDSFVQMLDLTDPCGAARGLPKADGVHVEHAGTAAQNADQWADDYSLSMLNISAMLTADAARRLNIPAVRLTPEQVAHGWSGFCGHIDVTDAYRVKGGHWDPGPSFPWDRYLEQVQYLLKPQGTPLPPAPLPAQVLAATQGDNVQVLVYTDPTRPTLITDGIRASVLGPGEDQTMKDLGLVQSTTPKWVAPSTYNRLIG